MAEIKLSGNKRVGTLCKEFKEAFGSTLRVYDGKHFAKENDTLASIRKGDAKGGELAVKGNMQVGNFEKKVEELFGIIVQVADSTDKKLVDNAITLSASGNVTTKARNSNKSSEIVDDTENIQEENKSKKTYYLRIQANKMYRMDTLNMEKATDKIVQEAFDERDFWTDIVGETTNLYTQKDDIDCGFVFGYEEKQAIKLGKIIGDNSVNCGNYLADAEDDFSIVVLDENENELQTLDCSSLQSFSAEQGYTIPIDEDETNYQLIQDYFEKNGISKEERNHAFPNGDANKWFWLNLQECEMDSFPILKLETQDNFDANKLGLKKVLIEEALLGIKSIEVVSLVLYEGQILEIEETGSTQNESATNYLIKTDTDGKLSSRVLDITNYEEA